MVLRWKLTGVHLFLASPLGAPAKHHLSFQAWLFLLRKSDGALSLGQGECLALHRPSVPFRRERGKKAKQQTGCEEWYARARERRNEKKQDCLGMVYVLIKCTCLSPTLSFRGGKKG